MQLLRLFAFCSVLGASTFAQSVESIPFRVNLTPGEEVPALTLNAAGFSTVWFHVVRDAAGQVVSGTVDFHVRYQFPGEVTFTGFHIHRGAAGTNGPVVLDTRITGANPVVDASGRGEILRPVTVPPGSPGVAVLNELLANPTNFYLNLHTTVNPGGAVRGQLRRTEYRVLGALLDPANEVPPVANSQARGIAFVTLLAGVEPNGALHSAEVTFDVNFSGFADATLFTGMHIHQGRGGANGPVTIDTGLGRAQNITPNPGGAGSLRYVIDVNAASAASVNTVYTLLQDPDGAYLNLHTAANPGGEIRGQLRSTEALRFSMLDMSPLQEVPPLQNLNARADGAFLVHLLRRPDGAALAAQIVFTVNYVFVGEVTFTGLHIHSGAAGVNGPVVLDSGIRAASTITNPFGFGNIYRSAVALTEPQVNALNGLLLNPRNYYINLHTTANPGGAVRAQLMGGATPSPRLDNVIQSVSDPSRTMLVPGGLMTLYGSGFTSVPANLDGWLGARAPTSLNGASVTLGMASAPILEVKPNTIIAQVPVETALGPVDLSVTTPSGVSNTLRPVIVRSAPSLFFDQIAADGLRVVAIDRRTGQSVTQQNPAAAGAPLAIFGTGFGPPDPPAQTGVVAFGANIGLFRGTRVIASGNDTPGGNVAFTIPGFIGLTQINFEAPAASGPVRLEVEHLGARSNATVLYMR